ncbi:MAG: hypothetical protein JXN63_06625 [Candidatus Delongbacteria bacterium]|nr:hypothetical protein [Candidatus Delongbacteria bacterium]
MKTHSFSFKMCTIITISFFLHSCTPAHMLKEVPKTKINEMRQNNVIVIHKHNDIFHLKNATLENNILTGHVANYTLCKNNEIYNELHLYLSNDKNNNFKLNDTIAININEIIKAEVYEIDMSIASRNLIFGFSSITLVIIIVIGFVSSLKYLQFT